MKVIFLASIAVIFAVNLYAQQTGTFKDPRDGKTYKTVKIGNQTWFAENLAYCSQDVNLNQKECSYVAKLYLEGEPDRERTITYNIYCNSEFEAVVHVFYYKPNSDNDFEMWTLALGENIICKRFPLQGNKLIYDYYPGVSKDLGVDNGDCFSIAKRLLEYYYNNYYKKTNTKSIVAYNNDKNNAKIYGYLYNWETAKEGCPNGWHLPTDDEWSTLVTYLGGESVAGGKMKETGTI